MKAKEKNVNSNSLQLLRKHHDKAIYTTLIFLVALTFVLGFAGQAYAFTIFGTDRGTTYFFKHTATITITLTTGDGNIGHPSIPVTLSDSQNSNTQTYTFNSIASNSFKGTINFTTTNDATLGLFTVRTLDPGIDQYDPITISYQPSWVPPVPPDTTTINVFSNDYHIGKPGSSITTILGNTPPTSKQPFLGVKRQCTTSDGDAICDSWKSAAHDGLYITATYTDPITHITWTNGTFFFSCPIAVVSGVPTPDPCGWPGKKEIFVKIAAEKDQAPSWDAINYVRTQFANQVPPILLHVYLEPEYDFHEGLTDGPMAPPNNSDFNTIKKFFFGNVTEMSGDSFSVYTIGTGTRNTCNIAPPSLSCTTTGTSCPAPGTWPSPAQNCIPSLLTAKRQAFHYALFGNRQSAMVTSSGLSDIKGNDMFISLGPFTGGYGSTTQQQGTFMHELGHNLGLNHGGPTSSLNCKPNYPSVMSYSQQMKDINPYSTQTYSSGTWGSLSQQLHEATGLGPTGYNTVFGQGSSGTPISTQTGVAVDYNGDGDKVDVLNAAPYYIPKVGCTTSQTNLNFADANDWGSLLFDMETTTNFGNGLGAPEIDSEIPLLPPPEYNEYSGKSHVVFVLDKGSMINNNAVVNKQPIKVDNLKLDDKTLTYLHEHPSNPIFAKNETTVDEVRNVRIAYANNTNNTIFSLEPGNFTDQDNADSYKQTLSDQLKDVENAIRSDSMLPAIQDMAIVKQTASNYIKDNDFRAQLFNDIDTVSLSYTYGAYSADGPDGPRAFTYIGYPSIPGWVWLVVVIVLGAIGIGIIAFDDARNSRLKKRYLKEVYRHHNNTEDPRQGPDSHEPL